MERIGFIGLGVMGQSMARNLIRAGHPLLVYTRTPAKAEALLAEGVIAADSPAMVASQCAITITMLGYPADVEQVYFGEMGIASASPHGALWIDMTTSSPTLARRIDEVAQTQGCMALDAPVSGGDIGAREARLSIMVGGAGEGFARAEPILRILGTNIVHQGQTGSGQLTKMANQIAVAASTMGAAEALAFAKKVGLDSNSVLQSIESGAAGSWSLSNLGPRMLAEDFDPGFYVKHIVKDLGIALDSAEEVGLSLPGLTTATTLFRQLCEDGGSELGTQAIYRLYCS
ncbi:NAD(P)-dependent oxidoreductase [Cerasicoccus arenae]|uniref:Putative oxidoreductase YkwC n=1 Tax=Cerasicoccus arenae TaxID=424488 RepID=A0A8J3GDR2_9BACT|nr:NAD(P)-dependent oxidoreductase [Cerasicoccus arenae]MBK1857961.1 NAD(P)-dependent oxidoreductase [Cerasicoccus arenae]GHB97798.1 putative oxidoreductase YkwC [Cerasicoccus arenae]